MIISYCVRAANPDGTDTYSLRYQSRLMAERWAAAREREGARTEIRTVRDKAPEVFRHCGPPTEVDGVCDGCGRIMTPLHALYAAESLRATP